MEFPALRQRGRDLMGSWEVFGRKLIIPGILNCGRRPLRGGGSCFRLLAMLIQAKGPVCHTFGLLDWRPLQMKFLLFLLKFRLGIKVAAKRSISFCPSSNYVDQLFILRCLR